MSSTDPPSPPPPPPPASARVALLTGATSGIGLACARALCEQGYHAVVSSRSSDRVSAAVSRLRKLGHSASGLACHAEDAPARGELVRHAIRYGKLHALIVCAASSTSRGAALRGSGKDFSKMLSLNVQAAAATVRDASPHFADGAVVVLLGSIAGYAPMPSIGLYSVTKAALHALVRVLANEMAPEVRVVGVAPGLIRTNFSKVLWEGSGEDAVRKIIPMQRIGEPEDVSDVVAFLCSEKARYITGETVVVAGGMHSRL